MVIFDLTNVVELLCCSLVVLGKKGKMGKICALHFFTLFEARKGGGKEEGGWP